MIPKINRKLAEKEQDLGELAIYLNTRTSDPRFQENLPPRVVEILDPRKHPCGCIKCLQTRETDAYQEQVETILKDEREKITHQVEARL